MSEYTKEHIQRKPDWLTIRVPLGEKYQRIRKLIADHNLHTVCQEANCPNRSICFAEGTATFLILGSICTRGCSFCNIATGTPEGYDLEEANRVVDAVKLLGLDYVVITSVTRDDLPDYGSTLFALLTEKLRNAIPACKVELLIPDFLGEREAFIKICRASPDVLNHNLETVRRLYDTVRPGANYDRSLKLFQEFTSLEPALILKSGLMVGLGESLDELVQAFKDLAGAGCRILTIGQYLQPSKSHHPVFKYYPPEEFEKLRQLAHDTGIEVVESAPLVRSSYKAKESYLKITG